MTIRTEISHGFSCLSLTVVSNGEPILKVEYSDPDSSSVSKCSFAVAVTSPLLNNSDGLIYDQSQYRPLIVYTGLGYGFEANNEYLNSALDQKTQTGYPRILSLQVASELLETYSLNMNDIELAEKVTIAIPIDMPGDSWMPHEKSEGTMAPCTMCSRGRAITKHLNTPTLLRKALNLDDFDDDCICANGYRMINGVKELERATGPANPGQNYLLIFVPRQAFRTTIEFLDVQIVL
jgi:hypothetical protein